MFGRPAENRVGISKGGDGVLEERGEKVAEVVGAWKRELSAARGRWTAMERSISGGRLRNSMACGSWGGRFMGLGRESCWR